MAEAKTKRKSRRQKATPEPRRIARLGSELALAVNGDGDVELLSSKKVLAELPDPERGDRESELKSFVREELAGLDGERRAEILDRLVSAISLGKNGSLELSISLHGIREMLRERLPTCVVNEAQPIGLGVEQILGVDDRSFWVNGWMHDEDGKGEITLVSPEGARTVVSEVAYRSERADVVQFYSGLGNRTRDHGFTAFFSLPAPSRLTHGWIAELRTSGGVQVELECPATVADPDTIRSMILGELGNRGPVGGELAAGHGRAALTSLQERVIGESEIDSVDTYGEPPADPAISIVIPLYKRIDFLEHQLLHFSTDPDLADAELVYVLDSVEQKDELAEKARELFALYGVPFRVVNLTSGAGFAGANMHGIEVASGSRLLLLNSDVIPDRPGWLTTMSEFYDSTDRVGALGAKLLYEDDSLQHAGLYFHRQAGSSVWENAHFFKGLHRHFPPAEVARPVPAVTAACMLIDRDRYEDAGGLPIDYVQGDYEDSHLCMKLAEAGCENWYLPTAELYHLEGQSYVPDVRRTPSEYNMWLHSTIWGEEIEKLMTVFDSSSAAHAAGTAL